MRKKRYPNWEAAIDELRSIQTLFDYKNGWFVHKLNCWKPPLIIWEYADRRVKFGLDFWKNKLPNGLQTEDVDLSELQLTELIDLSDRANEAFDLMNNVKKDIGTFKLK